VVHEKERKARENPKIIPISTRLKMKKLLDDNFFAKLKNDSFDIFRFPRLRFYF